MPIAGRLGDQMPMAEAQLVAANWWALLGTGRVAPAAELAEAHFGQAAGSRLYDVAAYLAVPYAYSAFAQGRVRTAMRRFTEVMPLLREHDALGDLRLANAMLAQAAAVAGDVKTARSALAVAGGTAPLTARKILSEVFIRLARAALAGQQGDAASARQLALEAAETARSLQAVGLEMVALHSVVCLDDSARVASRLAELARLAPGPLGDAFALHATASLAGDGRTLDNLVSTFESRGALLSAAEVAVHAAHAHVQAGNRDRARLSWHRARELKRQCEDAETPGLALLSTDEPDPLTAREREIGALAARGLTSREIAKRLGVSIRTVDNHLSHIFGKLQISSRRELRTLLLGPRREGDSAAV